MARQQARSVTIKGAFTVVVAFLLLTASTFYLTEPADWRALYDVVGIARSQYETWDAYSQEEWSNDSGICAFRVPDPWHPSIRHLHQKRGPLKCRPTTHGDMFSIAETQLSVSNTSLQTQLQPSWFHSCLYRTVDRVDDFVNKVDDWAKVSTSVRLKADVSEVSCLNSRTNNIGNDYVVTTVPVSNSTVTGVGIQYETADHPSVIVIGIDSMSHSNFVRTMGQTRNQLLNLGYVEFQRFTRAGENTAPNLFLALTGKRIVTYDNYTAEINMTSDMTFDHMNDQFVWHGFSQNGYATHFSEDAEDVGLFTSSYKGFSKQPTDHYLRRLFTIIDRPTYEFKSANPDDEAYCYHGKPLHVHQLNAVTSFIRAYQRRRKFALSWFCELSHNLLNLAGAMDNDMAKFFKENDYHLREAIVIVMCDHGIRFGPIVRTRIGSLETNLPCMNIRLPEKLTEKYPHLARNLRENARKMTSMSDLHETFQQIIKAEYAQEQYPSHKNRGYSLFSKIPDNRDCHDMEIPKEFCLCKSVSKLAVDEQVRAGAQAVVDHLNNITASYRAFNQKGKKCAVMTLKSVEDAYVEVQDRVKMTRVVFTTEPNDARFGAYYWSQGKQIKVDPVFERLNAYGNTSSCVNDITLRKVCYCVND